MVGQAGGAPPNMLTHFAALRSSRVLIGLWITAGLLLAAGDWVDRLPVRSDVMGALVVVGFILPLLTTMAALGVLIAWSVAGARRWHGGRPAYVSGLLLGEGLVLYAAGAWLRGLYGLDPPLGPFLLGVAMQLTAFSAPLVALILMGWSVAIWIQRRAQR
jgi:hypothetical protein